MVEKSFMDSDTHSIRRGCNRYLTGEVAWNLPEENDDMNNGLPATRIHHFSDSSLDAIHEVTAFLKANADAEYRTENADIILYQVIQGDHDPSETLYDAFKQCRIGSFAGTLLFMAGELALLQEEMANRCKVTLDQKLTLRASLIETALHETNDCLEHLEK